MYATVLGLSIWSKICGLVFVFSFTLVSIRL